MALSDISRGLDTTNSEFKITLQHDIKEAYEYKVKLLFLYG
jgi:hypothetical protein